MYRFVEIKDGMTEEGVNYVGVHPVKWTRLNSGMTPDAGFAEVDIQRMNNCENCKHDHECEGIWYPKPDAMFQPAVEGSCKSFAPIDPSKYHIHYKSAQEIKRIQEMELMGGAPEHLLDRAVPALQKMMDPTSAMVDNATEEPTFKNEGEPTAEQCPLPGVEYEPDCEACHMNYPACIKEYPEDFE